MTDRRLKGEAKNPATYRRCRSPLVRVQSSISHCMTKTLDMIAEVIRNRKHPFPQVADRPDKPHKNRYERRKIKQYIHLGNWAEEAKT